MVHIEVSHTFPVSVSEAFTYITEMKNWPNYWPDFVRIENPSEAKWSNPSDKVTVVIKLFNRERALNMELKEFKRNTRVTYISRHQGLPDARHERHFKTVSAGCEYRLVVEYEPRRGFAGIFDKLLVKRSVKKTLQNTVKNLDSIFQQRTAEA